MAKGDFVVAMYMGIVWFIGFSILWLVIFNVIKTARVQFFFIVFGIILVLLSGISLYITINVFNDIRGDDSIRFTAIGTLLSHILFAGYSLYTGMSSANPFNTNQRLIVVSPNTSVQKGGKKSK